MEKFILLGASRGLGWETYLQLVRRFSSEPGQQRFLLSSRKIGQREMEVAAHTQLIAQDFSKAPVNSDFFQNLSDFSADTLVYFAGGGPYGIFQNKKWTDHLWSLQTSFLYPAELLHRILSEPSKWPRLKRVVLVGSAIAEDKADPNAASYAAAKHALKGLIDTINAEQSAFCKVLLFSPGYMQTDLLPPNSWSRLGDRVENPKLVAERLIEYIEKT